MSKIIVVARVSRDRVFWPMLRVIGLYFFFAIMALASWLVPDLFTGRAPISRVIMGWIISLIFLIWAIVGWPTFLRFVWGGAAVYIDRGYLIYLMPFRLKIPLIDIKEAYYLPKSGYDSRIVITFKRNVGKSFSSILLNNPQEVVEIINSHTK